MTYPERLYMRKIDTRNFHLATRSTPREVNRQIVLNLIREHQPISRAELARRMEVRRSLLTTLVGELVASGAVYEKGTAAVVRGRRPKLLYVRTRGHLAVAVDVRPGRTSVALADFSGRVEAKEQFVTPASPEELIDQLAECVARLLSVHAAEGIVGEAVHGVGLVVPGMVDRRTGRVLYAPRLGWRDVDLRGAVGAKLGLPVYVESAPIACALARLWLSPEESGIVNSFAYVSVSEGVGVGLVLNGEALRGEAQTAGEFGHVSLDPRGPECVCGKRGCWEAFVCNGATVARYAAAALGPRPVTADGRARDRRGQALTVEEVVRRARRGEQAAVDALTETGRHIGRGLAAVVSAFNPGRVFIGGEVTAAWELLEGPIHEALAEETLTDMARATPVLPDRNPAEYRLLGAVALVAAPTFAAPRVG
ncbi:MAG TPA: ROK family transcriptional regulator [Gemmatimonadaceae bacterium]|nr:ROK family transcriptional regulator [Gemmatimonadaceae bacterium]